jgi:DNA polymerase-4
MRTILHCDMDNFYASVELLSRPDLAEKPVAVAGDPSKRHGIILAKNAAAKACGVRTAETISSARGKCPELVLLSPHHDKYHEYYKKLNHIYGEWTDIIEPFSVDESWLDVTASVKLFGSGERMAGDIKRRVRSELGLTVSIGVSFNKIFAKMGSELGKPDGLTVITQENFRQLLWDLPASRMFMIGPKTTKKLQMIGILTIGDIARASEDILTSHFGKNGKMMRRYACGEEDAPVVSREKRERIKSVSHGETFPADIKTSEQANREVLRLADKVASRLRRYGLQGSCVRVEVRRPNFETLGKQRTIPEGTNSCRTIQKVANELLAEIDGFPLRSLTIGISNLFEESFKDETLEETVDEIRSKLGKSKISFGGEL